MILSRDGFPIAYDTRGTGALALVLVHGWSCDRTYWAEQLEALSRRWRVVAVDLVGHGESGLGRTDWTIAAFGDDVAAVVEGLGLERVVLVGHSMGGDVILEAARRLPGRVAGLVWVDVYTRLGKPRTPEKLDGFLAPFRTDFAPAVRTFVRAMFRAGANPALVEHIVEDMAAAPPAIALPSLEAACRYDREVPRAIAELGLPLVAINPGEPPPDPSLAEHGVAVVFHSGVGHFPMLEDPAGFNARLEKIVAPWADAE